MAEFDVPREGEVGYSRIKNKLENLLQGREVELRNERGMNDDRLVCDVYIDGKNLVDYFKGAKLR